MSQRKLKKIRKLEVVNEVREAVERWGESVSIINIIKRNKWFLLLMSLLIALVYANSLKGDFVSDDYASITQNQQINDLGFMFAGGNTMVLGTYLVNLLFGDGSSVSYHVFNLLNLIAFCWLAFVVVEVIFDNSLISKLTLLLFAIHPIHVEAVSWISGRIYIVLGFYVMLGLLGFVLYFKTQQKKYLWLTLISFILGFQTDRPRPFAMFLLIGIYLMYVQSAKIKVNWGKILGWMLGVGVIFIALAWPYIQTRINIVNSGYNSSESIFYNPLFQYPTGLSKYFQLLWAPFDLTLYHTMYVFPVWLNWAILMTYLVAIIYFYFKNRFYFFALAFITAGVLPSIMPIKVSWLVAERYMFLGSLGFCLFLAGLITDISRHFKYLMPVFMALIMVLYSVRTVYRNSDWSTNHNLWVNTCQVSPNSHNAWNNIGDDYDKLKQYDNSIKGFTQSTIVKPNYADAFHNRANIFFKMGRLDLARDSYNTAIYFSPGLYQTYLSLVQIDLIEKKLDLALSQAQEALKLQPDNPQAAYVLAIVLSQRGENDKAGAVLQQIIRAYPEYTPAVQAWQQLKSIGKSGR